MSRPSPTRSADRWPTPRLAVVACVVAASTAVHAGDLCFDALPYLVGALPSDVVLGDFDGDGFLDMAVANHDPALDNRVAVLRNNGDGSFAPSVFYPVGDRPFWLVAGDFNGDGSPDLAVTNYFGASVSVLLNLGDGTFAPHTAYSVGIGPTFLDAADLDGDGYFDLVVANGLESSISVLHNQGDGTFARQVNYEVGPLPYGIVAADLNADGAVDVAVSNYGTGRLVTEVQVLLNDGAGGLATWGISTVGPGAVGLVAVDVDGDGYPDLVTADEGFDGGNQSISYLRNNGDATFATAITYVVGIGPYDVAATDFNADGRADLAVACFEGVVAVLINDGAGSFAPASLFAAAPGILGIGVGDLDGNGTPEIATAAYSTNEIWVLFNQFLDFVDQPDDVAAAPGMTVSFTAVATGPEPITYRWRRDGTELRDGGRISGAETTTLNIAQVTKADAGVYDLVATNDCGPLASAAATLTIETPSCPADLSGNGVVDAADLAVLLSGWGGAGVSDLNSSGGTDAVDLAILLSAWGPC